MTCIFFVTALVFAIPAYVYTAQPGLEISAQIWSQQQANLQVSGLQDR